MPAALILLIAFIGLPLIEVAVFIQVGGRIGVGWTIGLCLLTALIGTTMIRHQGLSVLQRAREQMARNEPPVREVFEGFCLVIAGALLLTPGFVTDALGGLLLLPPVRQVLFARVRKQIEIRAAAGPGRGSGRPGQPGRGPTIEGEFEDLTPEPPTTDGEIPPPRGDWGPRS
jgi:UPF0716 protein FxsA